MPKLIFCIILSKAWSKDELVSTGILYINPLFGRFRMRISTEDGHSFRGFVNVAILTGGHIKRGHLYVNNDI